MNKRVISMLTSLACMATIMSYSPISTIAATTPVKSEVYNWNNVKIGGTGYIPAVIFNQTEKDLIYARTDMGGAYRWNPTTNAWIPLLDGTSSDDWNLLGCDSLATDPVDTNRVYILAGTYTNSWTSQNGYILRSTDKGNTWQRTELPFKSGGNMPGRGMGERLMIDPNNNAVLYLGARSGNGLWKSIDYGVTWNKVKSFTDGGDYVYDPTYEYSADKVGVVWEVFDTTSSAKGTACKTIYVGVAQSKAKTAQSIYVSNDSGATWALVPGQPDHKMLPETTNGVTTQVDVGFLPHHAVLTPNGMMYLTYSNTCGPYDGNHGDVWKYDTKAKTWTNISPLPSSNTELYYGYGGLAVDAQHPDTLMVTSLNSWWPDAQIYRSLDAGVTWSPIWKWEGYPSKVNKYVQDITSAPWLDFGKQTQYPETPLKLGWMIDDIKIDPFNSDRMMYGTGATLYSTDNLTDWDKAGGIVKIAPKANGIEEAAVLALSSPPTGPQLLSGMFDVQGFAHTDVTKVPSKMYSTPSFATTSIDFAQDSPGYIVRVGNGDTKNNVMSIAYSRDAGGNWNAGTNITGVTGGGTVAMSSNGINIVWSPAGSTAPVSYGTGNGWTASIGIPSEAKVASDRVNPKKFYGLSGGKFYVSTDGGVNFTQSAATGLPVKGDVKAMAGHEGEIWIAGGVEEKVGSTTPEVYGIWHSSDSGATFTKLSNVDGADVIGFGKAAPGKDYMSIYTCAKINGVDGVFRSDNQGATWIRINDDAHQYGSINYAITGDPRIYGRVYFGTNGRGIIYGDTAGLPVSVTFGDVNGDDKINIADYILVKKYATGKITTFPYANGIKAADVNADGKIDLTDDSLIKSFILGKITAFTAK